MKKLLIITVLLMANCGDAAQSGLDIRTLPTIVKESKDAAEIERRVNEPHGINNVDLDKNDEVDYIYVTEKAEDGKTVFTFTTFSTGEPSELAKIDLKASEGQIDYHVSDHRHDYEGTFSAAEFLLLYYLLTPSRTYYVSPYQTTRPPTYTPYRKVDSTTYSTRTQSRQATTRPSSVTSRPSTTTSRPSSGTTSRPSAPPSRPSAPSRSK